jgi:hypothetical protein
VPEQLQWLRLLTKPKHDAPLRRNTMNKLFAFSVLAPIAVADLQPAAVDPNRCSSCAVDDADGPRSSVLMADPTIVAVVPSKMQAAQHSKYLPAKPGGYIR